MLRYLEENLCPLSAKGDGKGGRRRRDSKRDFENDDGGGGGNGRGHKRRSRHFSPPNDLDPSNSEFDSLEDADAASVRKRNGGGGGSSSSNGRNGSRHHKIAMPYVV